MATASLFQPARFTQFIASLPATSMVEQWESHVAKVGGKVFALLGQDGGHLVFKVEELSFDGLTALPNVTQAPYFARRTWVSVGREVTLSSDEIKAYIGRSHALVASKLTRKVRAELGL